MATGDQGDFVARLTRELPKRWFGDGSIVVSGALNAFASVGTTCYALVQFARAQMRLGTMTGGWLDLFALDYFGQDFPRGSRSDDGYRAAIQAELVRPRVTRAAITQALTDLTGRAPTIVEPWNPGDCGGWDTGALAWGGAEIAAGPIGAFDSPYGGWDAGALAFDQAAIQSQPGSTGAGCWGSDALPFQIFVTAHRQLPDGIPYAAGWDTGAGGWDAGALAFLGDTTNETVSTDQAIYDAINRTKAAGIVAWTSIAD